MKQHVHSCKSSELIKHSHRATHEHKIGEDSIKKESKKQESLPNNFHIEKERGCGEPLDTYTNDSLDYPQFQRPTPIKSVFVKKKKQGTNSKALHGKACDDRANTNNSEEGRYDGGNVLNTSNVLDSTEIDACRSSLIVDQSEPASERVVSSNDDFNKTPERPHELLTEDKQENAQSAGHDAKAGNAKMVVDILQEKESSSSRGRPRKEKQIIKCEYCGRPFNHASAYVIHRRVHTGEKPFSCQDCGKAFAQLSNLRSHSKIHNAPKTLSINECHDKSIIPLSRSRTPVACPICGKVFPYRSVLKIHLRIHSGEKPYACKVCGKAFTQACTVRVHERVHWSVKPFLCSKCGKGFSQIGTLKAHTCQGKKHTHSTLKEMELTGVVIFRCHLCKKCFNTREDYDLHLQTHTDSHRYICDSCGQTYSLRSELDTHRKYCFSMWLSKTKSYNRQPSVKLQNKNVESSETTLQEVHNTFLWRERIVPERVISQGLLHSASHFHVFSDVWPKYFHWLPQRDGIHMLKYTFYFFILKCWMLLL
uniref:C2H2-type domain-containing protein n=1 Tax=Electrophorus electricus TaxID=8005 RepID=A0AAY5F4M8_ELEEL